MLSNEIMDMLRMGHPTHHTDHMSHCCSFFKPDFPVEAHWGGSLQHMASTGKSHGTICAAIVKRSLDCESIHIPLGSFQHQQRRSHK